MVKDALERVSALTPAPKNNRHQVLWKREKTTYRLCCTRPQSHQGNHTATSIDVHVYSLTKRRNSSTAIIDFYVTDNEESLKTHQQTHDKVDTHLDSRYDHKIQEICLRDLQSTLLWRWPSHSAPKTLPSFRPEGIALWWKTSVRNHWITIVYSHVLLRIVFSPTAPQFSLRNTWRLIAQ